MELEHDIAAQILAAQRESRAADGLVRQYLPFIRAEAGKFTGRSLREDGDALSIAMLAFHEAVLSYRQERGAFFPFAARVIKNRLIDHSRRERRHTGHLSLEREDGEDGGSGDLLSRLSSGQDQIAERTERSAAKEEIMGFAKALKAYGLELTDIADNCPKQERTLGACLKALAYAKSHPLLLDIFCSTKKLPLEQLSRGTGISRKTLERHRRYMVAILLAYTNGFEIIRGHLQQVSMGREG